MTYVNYDLPVSAANRTHAAKTNVGFMQDSERGARLPITADYHVLSRTRVPLPGLVCTL